MRAAARSMVDLPIEELVKGNRTFIFLVERYGGQDPELWRGMERLARWAELDGKAKGVGVAQRLIVAFRHNPPPPSMNRHRIELRDLIWKWESGRQP